MVFQPEAQFEQFIHCKFREHVVRVLFIPWDEKINALLVVNKYGKVGLYDPGRFTLVHTYLLDLSTPMCPDMTKKMLHFAKRGIEMQQPKCQKTHLVVDAVYAPDIKCVFYLTTKGILQGYDIGEIQKEKYGVELLPGKSFGGSLRSRQSPATNSGHTESHRVYGLPIFPTVMEYSAGIVPSSHQVEERSDTCPSKLLIGDSDGSVTIIKIPNAKNIFGFRKIRGMLHKIKLPELESLGLVRTYKAHNEPITELRYFSKRQLVASSSRDRKMSLYIKDMKDVLDPCVISLPKGINTLAHSETLKAIATGSDDKMVRLFNQFVPGMPQVELQGHRAPIVNLQFLETPFASGPILLSFSDDVEIRAWDPTTYACVQSLYISFPVKSNIFCKRPEFARHAIFVYQPNVETPGPTEDEASSEKLGKTSSRSTMDARGQDGFLLALYCNSFAKLFIEREASCWPFDFDQLAKEFQAISSMSEKKLEWRRFAPHSTRRVSLNSADILEVDMNLDSYVSEVLEVKRRAEQQKTDHPFTSLSAQVTQRCFEMKNDPVKARLLQEGGAFMALPLPELGQMTLQTKSGQSVPVEVIARKGLTRLTCPEGSRTPKTKQSFPENKEKPNDAGAVQPLQLSDFKFLMISSDDENTDAEIQNISSSSSSVETRSRSQSFG